MFKVSTNGPQDVLVDEVQEHLVIPEYPDTKESGVGIAHFVHCPNPIPNAVYDLDEASIKRQVSEAFTQVMSSVRLTFKAHIQSVC